MRAEAVVYVFVFIKMFILEENYCETGDQRSLVDTGIRKSLLRGGGDIGSPRPPPPQKNFFLHAMSHDTNPTQLFSVVGTMLLMCVS